MSHFPRAGAVLLAFGLALTPVAAWSASVAQRTFDAPLDRVWTVTESVLKSLGWEVDTFDRAVGWILTDSRTVDFKEFAFYGKGLRQKLRLSFKAVGSSQTTVWVERDLYQEERILWMIDRKPVDPTNEAVETGILDAIQQGL